MADAVTMSNNDSGLVARLASQRTKFRAAVDRLTAERDDLKATLAKVTTERDGLAAKADTGGASKRVEELTAELRTLKHRAKFDELALKSGADPKKLGDLWELSKLKTDTDQPDETAIGKVIAEQKTAREWAFQAPQAEQPPANPDTIPRPGPASGQGGKTAVAPLLSEPQIADVKYQMLNFDRISADAADRVARGEI